VTTDHTATVAPRWRAPLQVVLVEILTLLALFGVQQYFTR